MKKQKPVILLTLLSSFLLFSCGGNEEASSSSSIVEDSSSASSEVSSSSSSSSSEVSSSSSSSSSEVVDSSLASGDEREIIIADIPDVGLGEIIDLADYVTVLRGQKESSSAELTWEYDILTDNVHKENVSVLSPERPIVGVSTRLQAIRTGRVNVRFSSGDVVKTAYFDVVTNDAMQKVADYFEAASDNNYTISYNSKPFLYRSSNYLYYPDQYWGIVINSKQSTGYYFQMDSVDDADSLRIGVKGYYSGDDTISPVSFNNDYPSLATIFDPDYFEYSASLESYFGEAYSIAMLYDSDDTTAYTYALNLLGLSTYTIYNNYYYYPSAFIPVIGDSGDLNLYVAYSTSRTTINGNTILTGPYVFGNVGTTSIAALDEYAAGDGAETLANFDNILEKLYGITSFTSHATGQYEDLDGNKIDVPSYFASALPELDVEVKLADNGYQNSRFDLVDGGDDENVLLLNGADTSTAATKYVLNSSGEATSSGEYGNDPTSGIKVTTWQRASTFSSYNPSVVFTSSLWKYVTLTVTDEANTYYMMGINDTLGKTAMNNVLRMVTADCISNSSSPIYYYGFYSYMSINYGETATDDMHGEFYTRLIDGNDDYYVYHLSFDITSINSTVLTVPANA